MIENNGGKIRKRQNPFSQVANHPLRNPELSLKAKGLYSVIQSFINIPDFTLYKSTLMNVCSEGKDAFESAWKELKKSGYLIQTRVSAGKGRFTYEYELLDFPAIQPNNINPEPEKPVPENPVTVKPHTVEPEAENRGNNKKNEKSYNDLNYNDIHSFNLDDEYSNAKNRITPNTSGLNEGVNITSIEEEIRNNIFSNKFSYTDYVDFVKNQIEFEFIKNFASYAGEQNKYEAAMEWVYLMADLYISKDTQIIINGSKVSMNIVKQKLLLINKIQMIGIFQNFSKLSGQQSIRNPRSYMISSLYNAYSASGITANTIEEKMCNFR